MNNMNQTHLKHISRHFNLGQQVVQPPERVHGGLLHTSALIQIKALTQSSSYQKILI
jgi:hypothetical protein